MALQNFRVDFGSATQSIEEVLGIDVPRSVPITLFDANFSRGPMMIGDGGAVDLVNGSYQFNFGLGLDLVIDRATLGNFQVAYPVTTFLNLPDFVSSGEVFEVATQATVDVNGATVVGESISLGNVGLDLNVSSSGARIDDLRFLEVTLPFSDPRPLVDPGLGPIIFDGFSEKVDLVDFDLSIGASVETIDGVEVSISSPGGEENTGVEVNASGVTRLPNALVEIRETLASISVNPIELLDFIPALRPLDVLTEDFGPFEFSFGGEDYSLEASYTLLAPFIEAGFGIVQSFEFIPDVINTIVSIGEETFEGLLGDAFNFTAPDDLGAPLDGTITYDIGGAVAVSYRLAPIGSIGVDALGGEFTLTHAGISSSLSFGPLLEASASGSTDLASLEIFRSDPIELPEDFFAPITQEFSIPTSRGQDIAFVIDTTGSMWDDIASVKSQANAIIDAVFDRDRGLVNSRIAVVGYNDPSTSTILSFTDQPDPEARKTAALNAINGISVHGGGDFPEMTFGGLLRALDGRAGGWRDDAVARKIILFGDATAKDPHLAPQVYALARDLGAAVEDRTDVDAAPAASSTMALSESVAMTTFEVMATDAETGAVTPVPVQIFTVAIGGNSGTISEFEEIAAQTGGEDFRAADASEIVDILLEVINLPIYSLSSSTNTVAEGDDGTTTVNVTVRRDVSGQAAVVTLALTGTADADDRALASESVAFAADETEKVVQLTILGDIDFEPDETVVVSIDSISESATVGTRSTTVTIINDDLDVPLGTDGPDDIFNPLGGQTIALGGGNDVLRGPVENFFADVVEDFGLDDTMVFEGTEIARRSIDVTTGFVTFAVDTDGDGSSNGKFTLSGDFRAGEFMAVRDSGDTLVTFETFLPVLQESQAVDVDLVNGIINQNFLKGGETTDFRVTLRDLGFAGYDNALGVYEVDAAGNIVDTRILFANANSDKSASVLIDDVEDGHNLGFFIVQDAGYWAATLAAGATLSFVNSSGGAANVSDGAGISIAVNGAAVDEMVFHSFAADMNSDGLQHALSGVEVGGEAITIGFEDLTGGGDRDYEDVVFRVELVDDFAFI